MPISSPPAFRLQVLSAGRSGWKVLAAGGEKSPSRSSVRAVMDWEYPHACEWTARSKAAGLAPFGISARPFQVEIEVMGSGPRATAPYLKDTVEVECTPGHMIRAEWVSRGSDEATNWVHWNYPRVR
jgi:hypothetical protein